MTYQEIIRKVGRMLKKRVYYFDNDNNRIDVDPSNIEGVKIKFSVPWLGTIMRGAELILKEEIETKNQIFIEVEARYDDEVAIQTYGGYYLHDKQYSADTKTYTHNIYDEMCLTMNEYQK